MRERDLTYTERATWGECPVCHAKDGYLCHSDVGIALGRTVSGDLPPDGVHLGRIQRAPKRVRELPVS